MTQTNQTVVPIYAEQGVPPEDDFDAAHDADMRELSRAQLNDDIGDPREYLGEEEFNLMEEEKDREECVYEEDNYEEYES